LDGNSLSRKFWQWDRFLEGDLLVNILLKRILAAARALLRCCSRTGVQVFLEQPALRLCLRLALDRRLLRIRRRSLHIHGITEQPGAS